MRTLDYRTPPRTVPVWVVALLAAGLAAAFAGLMALEYLRGLWAHGYGLTDAL